MLPLHTSRLPTQPFPPALLAAGGRTGDAGARGGCAGSGGCTGCSGGYAGSGGACLAARDQVPGLASHVTHPLKLTKV